LTTEGRKNICERHLADTEPPADAKDGGREAPGTADMLNEELGEREPSRPASTFGP